MSFDRASEVDRRFASVIAGMAEGADGPPDAGASTVSHRTSAELLALFESQLLTRHVDLMARKLRLEGRSYYTISSAGHEGNAALGRLVRHTDPALLHYRSGALMIERSRQVPTVDMVRDILLGVTAAATEPIAGGRHKVFGSVPLWVPPQTSTIASHLPKAVGLALAIDRANRLGLSLPIPSDSIVLCTFGDASLNHSTAQGALNTASWITHLQLPLPLLFVCEDNGLGISVPTPPGWVHSAISARPGLEYIAADGTDLVATLDAAERAVALCRRRRRPVFLHLELVRLLGHAGSDVEQAYRSKAEITGAEGRDPVLATAERLITAGVLSPAQVLEKYESARSRVAATAAEIAGEPQLATEAEVAQPLAPVDAEAVAREATRPSDAEKGHSPPDRGRHLGAQINRALHEAMGKYPQAIVFGEDVGRKGGVYHVTAGLLKRYGPARVFDTLLDEQAILGMACGSAQLGFLPIPEIQYLAYLHNAIDQLRGEACSLQFFSQGAFQNPMVVRIASFAYQKGFGGHFHNDNAVGSLREIPGLVIAAPARGDDAAGMLRTCLALAATSGRVVAFLEPIALYMTRDLHEDGDEAWLSDYPEEGRAIALGEGAVYHEGASDLTIVSYGNGLYLSLKAAAQLREVGIEARVLDMRWLSPINHDWIAASVRGTGGVLIVDECRRAGGVGEAVAAGLVERAPAPSRISLLAGADCYLPLGPAMALMLPSVETIASAATALVADAGEESSSSE